MKKDYLQENLNDTKWLLSVYFNSEYDFFFQKSNYENHM